jgi:hypothetical protein
MEITEMAIVDESYAETDLEKGQSNWVSEPSPTLKPSPATTSSTAFSQNKSEAASSRLDGGTQNFRFIIIF